MKWSEKLTLRSLYYLLLILYAGSVMPLILIGRYNMPAADDFSMALEVHERFAATGSFFAAVAEAGRMAYHYYMTWTGYYFSDFLTALSPSVFGEYCYLAVPVILLAVFTFAMLYFFHALLTKWYGVRWHVAGSIAFLVMLLLLQCMPAEEGARVQALYWWPGACNYLLMWSLGVLWAGLLLSAVCDDGKKRVWDVFAASLLGLLLGGANYMTGLTLALISVLVIWKVLFLPPKKVAQGPGSGAKRQVQLLLPCLLQIAGFAAACFAPGNRIRGGFGGGFSPVKSVLLSLYYPLYVCFGEWMTWTVLCLIVLLLPLLWIAVKEAVADREAIAGERFRHPVWICILAYGLTGANMTPVLYMRGDLGAGRMLAIIWTQFVLLLALTLFYLAGYAAEHLPVRKAFFKYPQEEEDYKVRQRICRRSVLALSVFWLFGSALCVGTNPHYYTSVSAVTDLVNGCAAQYGEESAKRLQLLSEDTEDVVLPAYSVQPELLLFSDITEDETEWVNTAMAEYYHKRSVRMEATQNKTMQTEAESP